MCRSPTATSLEFLIVDALVATTQHRFVGAGSRGLILDQLLLNCPTLVGVSQAAFPVLASLSVKYS